MPFGGSLSHCATLRVQSDCPASPSMPQTAAWSHQVTSAAASSLPSASPPIISATYLMQSSQRYMTASLPWRCSLTRCSPLRVWQLWQYIDCPSVVILTVKYLPHRYKHPCCAARSAAVWMRANPSPADARPHAVDAAFLTRPACIAKGTHAVDNAATCRYMPDRLYMMAFDVGFYRLGLAR